ncbi:MAG: DeoR family transcriptional regulator [Candidatus Sungbacteria bacterium]|nr:DeoR family transcriptional regulator [Candidatus Sungbacteria bacterium]
MGHLGSLPVEIRQKVYSFILSIYETFEPLPVRGVLVNDIESTANRALGLVARYGTFELKDKLLRDILGEVKQLKAFLGIARDTSFLERQPAAELLMKCATLENIFSNMLGAVEAVEAKVEQPAEVSLGISGIGPDIVDEAEPSNGQDTSNASDANHEAARARARARRGAIIEVLKHRDKVSVGDLGNLFMGKVSRKTLLRDLQEMVDQGVVEKGGDKRWTHYSLPKNS